MPMEIPTIPGRTKITISEPSWGSALNSRAATARQYKRTANRMFIVSNGVGYTDNGDGTWTDVKTEIPIRNNIYLKFLKKAKALSDSQYTAFEGFSLNIFSYDCCLIRFVFAGTSKRNTCGKNHNITFSHIRASLPPSVHEAEGFSMLYSSLIKPG